MPGCWSKTVFASFKNTFFLVLTACHNLINCVHKQKCHLCCIFKLHQYGLFSRLSHGSSFSIPGKNTTASFFHSPLLVFSGHAALALPACSLQIWCIRALNLPRPISCLFIAEVDGPEPVGPGSRCRRVNTLKSEGQRGWSHYWYHPWNHFVNARDSERQTAARWLLNLGWGLRDAIKKANVIKF